jgi:hypothetical protein
VGGEGVIGDHHPLVLSEDEQRQLQASASKIREITGELLETLV